MNYFAKLTLHDRAHQPVASQPKAIGVLDWLAPDMQSAPRWQAISALALCICVAIGASSYLLWAHVTSSPIAGCGNGGGWIDCQGVANSRWSTWLGVPVSILALAIYIAMAAALVVATSARLSRPLQQMGWAVVTAAAFAAGMSAVWFIVIQLLVLQHICLYCMLAHACGLVATATMIISRPFKARTAIAIALLSFGGLLALISGQVLAPPPATFEIERYDSQPVDGIDASEFSPPVDIDGRDEGVKGNLLDAPGANIGAPTSRQGNAHLFLVPAVFAIGVVDADASHADPSSERIASIRGGAIKLKVAEWPHIGPSNAKYVMVELFDYCCPPCRETFKAIRGAQQQLGEQVAIVLMPVPLDSSCNPTVKSTGANYRESCALAKLAVATWRLDRDAFRSLHMWMMEEERAPSYATAIARAKTLVDPKSLDTELASGVPDQFIARHVAIYKQMGEGMIPKLMFPRTSVIGKFTSADALTDLIRREGM
jgi:uncharacterized membrane protein/protein-disulfide isomerase